MKSTKFKSVTFSLLSSLTLLGISFTAVESARADLFGDLQRGVRQVNERSVLRRSHLDLNSVGYTRSAQPGSQLIVH
jgi:hypothetical protein